MAYDSQIPDFFVPMFNASWEASLLRTNSVLAPYCTAFPFQGKSKKINFLEDYEFSESTAPRMADTTLSEINGTNRWLINKIWRPDVTPAMDEWDTSLLAEIASPQSEVISRLSAAYRRSQDVAIKDAISKTVYSGDQAPTTANSLPAGNTTAHGSTGLTLAKITAMIRAVRLANHNPLGMVGVISAYDEEYLITNVAEIRSKDYSAVQPIDGGTVFGKRWLGIDWVDGTQFLDYDKTNHTCNCLFFDKQSIYFNPGEAKGPFVETRVDKSGATQFRMSCLHGAARVRDGGARIIKTYYAAIA